MKDENMVALSISLIVGALMCLIIAILVNPIFILLTFLFGGFAIKFMNEA